MSSPRMRGALLGLILATAPVRASEVPHLLADVDRQPPGPAQLDLTAQPSGFLTLGGRLLFSTVHRNSADDGILWSTDGTASGTVQVSSSLCSSPCGGMTVLGAWRGLGFLLTYPESGYPKLWRTDGTAAGTALLRNAIGEPQYYLDFYSSPDLGAVYFTGYNNDRGYGFWVSDGTPAGTRELLGADGAPLPLASGFTAWQGRLYFMAYRSDGTSEHQGGALWSTDGTAAGTRFIAEVPGGTRLVATPSHLFFSAGESSEDLWVTGGALGDAHRLLDLDPPVCSPPPDSECDDPAILSMFASGDSLYFKTARPGHGVEIWRSDGTETGTRPAIELPASAGPIGDLRRLGETWIFSPFSGGIWTADGDLTRAAPLTGCDGGACPDIAFFLTSPGAGKWLFAGYDPVHGAEPWVTDGTGPGTRLLADTCPGSCSGLSVDDLPGSAVPSPYGGIFLRTRASSETFGPDRGLWLTDGTPEGTRRVAESTEGVGFLNGLAWYGRVSPKAGSVEALAHGRHSHRRPAGRRAAEARRGIVAGPPAVPRRPPVPGGRGRRRPPSLDERRHARGDRSPLRLRAGAAAIPGGELLRAARRPRVFRRDPQRHVRRPDRALAQRRHAPGDTRHPDARSAFGLSHQRRLGRPSPVRGDRGPPRLLSLDQRRHGGRHAPGPARAPWRALPHGARPLERVPAPVRGPGRNPPRPRAPGLRLRRHPGRHPPDHRSPRHP